MSRVSGRFVVLGMAAFAVLFVAALIGWAFLTEPAAERFRSRPPPSAKSP